MSQFDALVTALVETEAVVYADDATFAPVVGPSSDIRIVLALHNEAITLGGFENEIRAPGLQGRVPKVDLPATTPVRGDTVVVITGFHAGPYTVKDVTEDLEKSEWLLDLS